MWSEPIGERGLKMRKRRTKAKQQALHARRRALQRFDLSLSGADMREIVSLIQRGEAKFRLRQSNRVSVFEVQFGGHVIFPVYDGLRQTIATFLTEEMVKTHE